VGCPKKDVAAKPRLAEKFGNCCSAVMATGAALEPCNTAPNSNSRGVDDVDFVLVVVEVDEEEEEKEEDREESEAVEEDEDEGQYPGA